MLLSLWHVILTNIFLSCVFDSDVDEKHGFEREKQKKMGNLLIQFSIHLS